MLYLDINGVLKPITILKNAEEDLLVWMRGWNPEHFDRAYGASAFRQARLVHTVTCIGQHSSYGADET